MSAPGPSTPKVVATIGNSYVTESQGASAGEADDPEVEHERDAGAQRPERAGGHGGAALASTAGDSRPEAGGAPAPSGATMSSRTTATSSWPAGTATPDAALPPRSAAGKGSRCRSRPRRGHMSTGR
jgi:hypothetical protein